MMDVEEDKTASVSSESRLEVVPSISYASEKWSKEGDELLFRLAAKHGTSGKKTWEVIASHFPGRSSTGCRQHFNILKAQERSATITDKGAYQTSEDPVSPVATMAFASASSSIGTGSTAGATADASVAMTSLSRSIAAVPTSTGAGNVIPAQFGDDTAATWSDAENKELLFAYLAHGSAWQAAQTKVASKSILQIQQHWYDHVCPCIKKFFANYYHPMRFRDSADLETGSMDTQEAEALSCPLYGVSDIPFVIQALRYGASNNSVSKQQ